MTALVNFFEGIGDALMSVLEFVIDFFKDIAYLVQLTGEFLLNIPDYISWLPAPVVAILLTAFGVAVVYKVVGRE